MLTNVVHKCNLIVWCYHKNESTSYLFIRQIESFAELSFVLGSQISVPLEGFLQTVDLLGGECCSGSAASRGRCGWSRFFEGPR